MYFLQPCLLVGTSFTIQRNNLNLPYIDPQIKQIYVIYVNLPEQNDEKMSISVNGQLISKRFFYISEQNL